MALEAFHRGFDALVLLISWELCKEHNRRTIDGITKTTTQVVSMINNEAEACLAADYQGLAPLFAKAT
jgi:hypothetical protein